MSSADVTVTRYTCDNCGSYYDIEPGEEPPLGFHGSGVLWVGNGGGTGCAEWYACKAACLKGAVEKAVKKFGERD